MHHSSLTDAPSMVDAPREWPGHPKHPFYTHSGTPSTACAPRALLNVGQNCFFATF